MKLTTADYQSIQEILISAGKEAIRIFDGPQEEQMREWKADFSVVSKADQTLEEMVSGRLKQLFPDVPVIGEENGGTLQPGSWVIDPVDGTSSFLSGLPLWTISLGFINQQGKPEYGFLYIPMLQQMICIDDQGQLRRNRQLIPRNLQGMSAFDAGKSSYFHKESQIAVPSGFYKRLGFHPGFAGKVRNFGSTALHGSMVACRNLTAALIGTPKLWDIAAAWAHLRANGMDFYACTSPGDYAEGDWVPLDLGYFFLEQRQKSRLLAGSHEECRQLARAIRWDR